VFNCCLFFVVIVIYVIKLFIVEILSFLNLLLVVQGCFSWQGLSLIIFGLCYAFHFT
jgi:hypothetical protein